MTVLEARKVSKTFEEGKSKVEVLKGVSLGVQAGEVVALEGPSGSGKTTLLSILGCILSPTAGEVVVAGKRVTSSRPEVLRDVRRRAIGFVFQQYNLFPALSAVENVEYALNVKGVTGKHARRQAEQVLERVGLGDRMGFLPRDLSGGQKQRIAIARALLLNPRILILDDSTSSVDLTTEAQIQKALDKLMRGRTSFVIAQRISTVMNADLILVLDKGQIVAQGQHEDLLETSELYTEIYTSQLIGDAVVEVESELEIAA
jgi:ABC-type multidrug transport system fused ATPase/permease subunit